MRVHWCVVNADFIVEVGPGAASAGADEPDHVAAMDGLADRGAVSGKVSVESADSVTVIDDDGAPVAVDVLRSFHNPISGSDDRRS